MAAGSWREEPIIPLSELLKIDGALSLVERALSSFRCEKNSDEEDFLHNKAIFYERNNKARTYLVYDDSYIHLLGYFTIAFKSIDLKNISKTKRKDMTAGEDVEVYSSYLIGHIAKNSNMNTDLTGAHLLHHAKSVIAEARDLIGGRLIYIDCKDIEQLKTFYLNNGFKYFNTSEKTGLLQYYFKI